MYKYCTLHHRQGLMGANEARHLVPALERLRMEKWKKPTDSVAGVLRWPRHPSLMMTTIVALVLWL
jgi:hypothetical protein